LSEYNQQIAARLARLAATGSTGALPISGYSSGAIYLLDGRVIGAESSRIPAATGLGGAHPAGADPAGAHLSQATAIAEATVDAVLDLLSSRSTCSRFRPARVPADTETIRISVADLLSEVIRRRRLLQQMASISADLALVRSPELPGGRVQLTAAEWALLIRVRPRSTPRELAWALRRSVFGTTVDVHRLVLLGLLRTADRQVQAPSRDATVKPTRRIRSSQRTAAANPTAGSALTTGSTMTALSFAQALSSGRALSGQALSGKVLSSGQAQPSPAPAGD
jgi:hypothetical protein